MDHNGLYDCLVAWVRTFNLDMKCDHPNDFKDGIILAKCLNNIDPDYFNDEWLSKIKTDTNDNWRLKLLNLKKILQTLTDYYSEVLNHSLGVNDLPNLNLIVESDSEEVDKSIDPVIYDELTHLLQLILGCAVNCQRKSEFIKNIMEMNESTQHMIMTAIQELMSKDPNSHVVKSTSSMSLGISADDDISNQLKRAVLDLNRITEQKDDIDQKCKRLDRQVSELQDEKMALISEIEMLKTKLQHEDNARVDPNNDHNKHIRLQQKLEMTQEELFKVESEKEKYRIQFEAAKAEQDILIEKNIELKKLAQEHQSLKDEIDILKHTSDKVEKLESTIEAYKIKLEDMADLRKQIKSLEENNTNYLEKILTMEEEVKKIATFKSQIEMYKKQIQELHEQRLSDEMKMKKLEYEYKSAEEACNLLRSEKEKMQTEYFLLKSSAEKARETSERPSFGDELLGKIYKSDELNEENSSNQIMEGLFSSVELVNVPSETKEKIIRLYHENKMLKVKQNDLIDERLMMLQTQYDDEKSRANDLQVKLNETSKEKIELECKLNDMKKSHSSSSSASSTNTNNSLNNSMENSKSRDDLIDDLKTKLQRAQSQLEEEAKNNETNLKKLEKKIETLINEKNELKETKEKEISAKEKEIVEINEKYRIYLEKAKVVIKSLDPRNGSTSNHEIQFLKTQLTEKDKIIKQLTKDNEKLRNSREQEEQLIASAWYNLGANLNRRVTDERICSIGNSFLSQQRHLPPNLNSSASQNSLNMSRKSNQLLSPTSNSSFKVNPTTSQATTTAAASN